MALQDYGTGGSVVTGLQLQLCLRRAAAWQQTAAPVETVTLLMVTQRVSCWSNRCSFAEFVERIDGQSYLSTPTEAVDALRNVSETVRCLFSVHFTIFFLRHVCASSRYSR